MTEFLGIDIGSSAVKAATFDESGLQLAVARVPCASAGEFEVGGWLRAILAALAMLDLTRIAAVGVCGRGGTNVLLDSECSPVAPSWDHARYSNVLREVRDALPELSPQAQNLLARARWWEREHPPVAFAVAAKDYVGWWLTGSLSTDPASGGGDVPPLVPARDPWSLLGEALAGHGLPGGIPVAVGWHDGAAATLGAGAALEGVAPVTLGTHAVFRVVTTELPTSLRKYWDLTPGLTVTGGDILAGGMAFEWARKLLGDAEAAKSPPGANGALFLPQLLGRIAPDVRRDAVGTWHGLTPATTQHDLLRAVVEGVAFSLRQVRDWLDRERLAANRVVATGGGARSALQAQALADILGTAVEVANAEEGCRGAALLGAVAAGAMSIEQARLLAPAYTVYGPNPEVHELYEDAYSRWRRLQTATDTIPGRA